MNINDINSNSALKKIAEINAVEGFNPNALAADYTDLTTGATCRRLPVLAQVAWFRLKYPEGKIMVSVKPNNGFFEAHAKIYKNYMDPADCFLAEASATRAPDKNKPTVSPKEWAQTAAIGIALRNAGFGLQFTAAGDSFDFMPVDEFSDNSNTVSTTKENATETIQEETASEDLLKDEKLETESGSSDTLVKTETAPQDPLEIALAMPCPIEKYKGLILGDLITTDPRALAYVSKSKTYDSKIVEAAKLICEYACESVGA